MDSAPSLERGSPLIGRRPELGLLAYQQKESLRCSDFSFAQALVAMVLDIGLGPMGIDFANSVGAPL